MAGGATAPGFPSLRETAVRLVHALNAAIVKITAVTGTKRLIFHLQVLFFKCRIPTPSREAGKSTTTLLVVNVKENAPKAAIHCDISMGRKCWERFWSGNMRV